MKRAIFALGICFLILAFGCILYGAWMINHGFSTSGDFS
jgi:hypothetical protein